MADKIFLGLGSNKGERLNFLRSTVSEINKDKYKVVKLSSVYETRPFGNINQQNFYNAVIEIKTNLELLELFEYLKGIEKKLGREKFEEKWGPREIDVDILFYNQLIYTSDKLSIPHPGILYRDFVLVPLIEIAGEFIHPVEKKRLNEFDLSLIEKHIIQKLNYNLV